MESANLRDGDDGTDVGTLDEPRLGWILSERQVRAGPIVIVDVATHEELYRNSSEIMGGAVSVKVAADTAAGAGWYWYELIGTSVFADSVGAGILVSCHRGNYRTFTSRDLILAPFPPQ